MPDWRIHTPELIAYPELPGVPAAVIDMDIKNYVWNMEHEPPAEAFTRSLAKRSRYCTASIIRTQKKRACM
ncbi:hypothetical protein PO124_12395 [Bacillus licheniformis]|nr:hypothetical protein [Bacillus licheniformis]